MARGKVYASSMTGQDQISTSARPWAMLTKELEMRVDKSNLKLSPPMVKDLPTKVRFFCKDRTD